VRLMPSIMTYTQAVGAGEANATTTQLTSSHAHCETSPRRRYLRMTVPRIIAALACAATLIPSASTLAASSAGTSEQIAWVRRAASNFVAAELAGNGAGACAILNAPLRTTQHHRTCAQRWNAKLSKLLREPHGRARLHTLRRAIPSATVIVHDYTASINLPTPLMQGPNRFLWTENCWMLEG